MSSRSRVPGEQRVFSLVLALIASPQGLTKRELLSSVYGYSDRYEADGANAALDRQFERDKDQLRSLGVPVDTLDSPLEPGNNQLTRYRISRELLEFPEAVHFSERELTLLRIAAIAWREGSLSSESRRAAMKLQALGAGFDPEPIGVAPRIGAIDPAAAPLQRAIDSGTVVRFDYRLPSRETPLGRIIAPLELHRADGRWHLIGWDIERQAGRVFLLSRISGRVQPDRESFDPALRRHIPALITELRNQRDLHVARVSVRRGTVAEATLTPRARDRDHAASPRADAAEAAGATDAVELVIDTLDPHVLAAELVEFGPDVVVREPASLRSLVVQRLRAISTAHAVGSKAEHEGLVKRAE